MNIYIPIVSLKVALVFIAGVGFGTVLGFAMLASWIGDSIGYRG